MAKATNHPVHVLDSKGELSASSFIPFCEFGGNMSLLGVKAEQFQSPVCNSFKEKIVQDQLCYEMNINDFSNSTKEEEKNKSELLKSGLILLLDYNEDRQIGNQEAEASVLDDSLESRLGKAKEESAQIYLDTIGIYSNI